MSLKEVVEKRAEREAMVISRKMIGNIMRAAVGEEKRKEWWERT